MSEPTAATNTTRAQLVREARGFDTDFLPCSMALLDESGCILAVNAAWRRFGRENNADEATAAGAGGFSMLAGRPIERVGLLDAEAVAAYLRRLPQPVEVEASAAFQSTRR